jgi:hypothetical protein
MALLFQACVVLGGVVLLLQVLVSLFGLGGNDLEVHAPPDVQGIEGGPVGEVGASDALSLLSVRAISAGTAVFGASGLALLRLVPGWLAALVSIAPALLVATLVAWLTRMMLRMETSGSLRLQDAVGQSATVYLTIPPASSDAEAHGLIQLTLQGRSVELRAVTREPVPLKAGSSVVVLAVSESGEVAEVIPSSTFEDMLHVDADAD